MNGKLTINGQIYSSDDGRLDLTGTSGSVLTGAVDISGDSTDGVANYSLTNSTWNINGDSRLTTLNLTGTDLNFIDGHTPGYYKMTVGTLLPDSGSTANMRTHLAIQQGDQLKINDLTNDLSVIVTDTSSGNFNSSNTWLLAETDSASVGAIKMDNLVDAGAYQYKLAETDNGTVKQYRLVNNATYSTTTQFVPNFARAGFYTNYVETNSLMKRMGDVRDGDNQGNVWGRVFGGEMKIDGNGVQAGFTQDYHGFQVGGDKKISSNDKRDIYVGAHLGYTKGNSDYGASGSGDIDSYYGGLYGIYHQPKTGFYVDGVVKVGTMRSKQEILQSSVNWVDDKDSATSWSASVEVGQRFFLKDKENRQGFYLEPQAKLSYGYTGSTHFDLGGTKVDVDSNNFSMGRIGFLAGYDMKKGKNPINIYGKLSWVSDFGSDLKTTVGGQKFTTDLGSNWWVYGLGITSQIKDKHNLYLDLERASGGDFTQKWQLNGGYRFAW